MVNLALQGLRLVWTDNRRLEARQLYKFRMKI